MRPDPSQVSARRTGKTSARSAADTPEKLTESSSDSEPGSEPLPVGRSFLAVCLLAVLFLLLQVTVFAASPETNSVSGESSSVLRDLLVVFILVLVTGVFVLSETALLTVRPTRIEQLVEEKNRSAQMVAQLKAEPTRMLATLQVGLTLVQLFSAGEAANRFVEPFQKWLMTQFAGTFVAGHAGSIAFVTIIMTVGLLTLVIGEITPKSIAIRHSEKFALLSAWPIRWLQVIASPLVSLVTFLSSLLVHLFGGTVSFHPTAYSEEELKIMVDESEEHGVIETEEKEMIHNVFEFADTIVHKVMTPRLDITSVEADAGVDKLIEVVTKSGHSRLPVYDDNLDNIVGVVHVKDVLRGITGEAPAASIRDVMREPFFIPDNKRVGDLLRDFKRGKVQIAIVQDEYGTVTGVVTIEDLLEEIVGEIQDEYDEEEELLVRQVDEHTCIMDGRLSLEDFNDRMGTELPIEEVTTLGGFVFGLLGHQPEQGEIAKWDGLTFQVEATDGKRIQRVCVQKERPLQQNNPTENGQRNGAGTAHSSLQTQPQDTEEIVEDE